MKILQINNHHYIRGGSEIMYLKTGELLEENGHEVIYFSTQYEHNVAHGQNSYFVKPINFMNESILGKIRQIPRFIYSTEAYHALKKLIRAERPDIAHLHIFYGNLTSAVLQVLKEEKIPVVMSIHEYKILCPAYTFLNGSGTICEKCAKGNYIHAVVHKCNKRNYFFSIVSAIECYFRDLFIDYKKHVDHFIMVSGFIMNKHLEHYPALESKSTVLYNFSTLNTTATPLLSQVKKTTDLVYFGRLSKEKGILTLLEVLKNKPQISLKIIGTGPMQQEIESYIKTNKMTQVSLLGFCSGKVLSDHIQSAKYSVIPSEWYESLSLTILESFSLGVPVIGANIGGIPEMIKPETGFIFTSGSKEDLNEKLETALSLNDDRYTEIQKNALEQVKSILKPNWYYTQLLGIYQKTIAKKNT
ncbi:MAG: glycosyltransferase [Sphingobacteriaceae bacterium]|nr:glycosyltransferase [Sphingobacteriaceae bacterium]